MSYCKRCDNVRRVGEFKEMYRMKKPRARYLKAQRERRQKGRKLNDELLYVGDRVRG